MRPRRHVPAAEPLQRSLRQRAGPTTRNGGDEVGHAVQGWSVVEVHLDHVDEQPGAISGMQPVGIAAAADGGAQIAAEQTDWPRLGACGQRIVDDVRGLGIGAHGARPCAAKRSCVFPTSSRRRIPAGIRLCRPIVDRLDRRIDHARSEHHPTLDGLGRLAGAPRRCRERSRPRRAGAAGRRADGCCGRSRHRRPLRRRAPSRGCSPPLQACASARTWGRCRGWTSGWRARLEGVEARRRAPSAARRDRAPGRREEGNHGGFGGVGLRCS